MLTVRKVNIELRRRMRKPRIFLSRDGNGKLMWVCPETNLFFFMSGRKVGRYSLNEWCALGAGLADRC